VLKFTIQSEAFILIEKCITTGLYQCTVIWQNGTVWGVKKLCHTRCTHCVRFII